MSKQSPPPAANLSGAAQQQGASSQTATNTQTQANRPDQSNPFASASWTQGPNGQWQENLGFGGPLGGASGSLMQQFADANAKPFTFGNGDEARQQAFNAAYNQETSRLNPQWNQQQEQLQTQLANQGLQPGSAAYNQAMDQFSRQKNDAYQGAMNNAVNLGNQEQAQTWNQNYQSALAQREQPLQEMGQMMGLEQMPSFTAAGAAQPTQYLPAAMGQWQEGFDTWQAQQQQQADAAKGAMQGIQGIGSALPFIFM